MFICLENFIAIYIKYFQQGSSDKPHCSKGIMTSDVLLEITLTSLWFDLL